MDEITKAFIQEVSRIYPGYYIRLTHQFLDGEVGKECGYTPICCNGKSITISGAWWK